MRQMIIGQNMKPGDRLPSEAELIEMFNVSRSTIRESMKLLKAENIVEIHRGKGTFISERPGVGKDPLGLDFVDQETILEQLLEARLMIEPQIAFLAAQRATPANIERLKMIIQKMQQIKSAEEENRDVDIDFHTMVAKCTQNDVLHRVVPIINESIREGYVKTSVVTESFNRAQKSHLNIFNAIQNRDAMTARYEAEKHIRQTIEDVKKIIYGR
ncbi:GntR family transcriptional regulator [Sporanaerobium hydrogeniformans]|uniref:GntR family transcriptional regulator n=2 Tax=Sporanaerobium hydrogeniformans TaxID=3072179 RepID=A0AC61D9J5_9FIRM|nr:GntR family transcriptional regulator [Sporanaerobium hydrogeniformans]